MSTSSVSSATPAPEREQVQPAKSPADEGHGAQEPSSKWRTYLTPILVLLLALAIPVTITRNWNSWEGGHVEQVTDDAYVRGDLTPLSTKVAGIVQSVLVSDYQQVRKGDLLVELEDSDYKAQVHLTDTQLIEIYTGTLGAGVPPVNTIINQGGTNLVTSGTQLTQPLTTLLKIRPANDMAQAELKASQQSAKLTENDVALKVHQLYYKMLIAEVHRSATEARIRASQDLQSERVEQVKFGSTLEQKLIESRVQLLQAKQELRTTDLQLSDLKLQLNDAMGLPLTTPLDLDANAAEFPVECERESCVKLALEAHSEITAARHEVEKAAAAVHLAKVDIGVPDTYAFARYSYQNNVPFLARNFGTFGVHFSYDLFDSGRKRAVLRERESQLAQAKENLARLTDEVELAVQTAYNKLERTQQMLKVSQELLALRTESSRVLQQEFEHGAALSSQSDLAIAQEYDAKTLMLQSQLDYTQAHDEITHAMGRTPE